MKNLVFLFSLLISMAASAAVRLPHSLTANDRKTMLELLGFGSQSRLLSSPVPLGGYQGFEMGLSSTYIPIEDLGALGDKKTNAKGEFNVLELTFGKGLGYNVDTFFHMTPMPQNEGIFAFGGQVRWGFHEFQRFPAILSFVLHGSGANFSNLLDTRTTGGDFIVTVAMDGAALYFGGGPIRTIGTFIGGPVGQGINAEDATIDEDLNGTHSVAGLSMNFGTMFLALEVDRVEQSTYGGRLGVRF